MEKREIKDLQQLQALPLSLKVKLTKRRIRDWVNHYGEEGVHISFSGGKDSTVLMHLVREDYPDIPAVFVDVPTQYPELRQFVQTFDNVEIVRPKISFVEVCEKYGFPLISKEVSERVYYAQKYLAWWKQSKEHLDDQPTDYSIRRFLGIGKTDAIPDEWMEILLNADGKGTWKIKELLGKATDKEGRESLFNYSKYAFLASAPFRVSNKCCDVMKKAPLHAYEKKHNTHPMTAQMASESRLRTQKWLQNGCNGFDLKTPISNPMSFWTEQDVLLYIYQKHDELMEWRRHGYLKVLGTEDMDALFATKDGLMTVRELLERDIASPICSVYGNVVKDNEIDGQMDIEDVFGMDLSDQDKPTLKTTGCDRTGCMLCGFGCHLEKCESRFERLHRTHPKMYAMLDVIKNNGVTFREGIDWTNEHGHLNIRY